ncbi:MAG: serine/threonine protein kinase [Thermoflexales bacterium]|nr:serine/threonine protein kinase [Thermoflexales bacterium]
MTDNNTIFTTDLTGHRLGQYEILERITKGSTATIYKAYQPKLERHVAVKVLSPHVIDEEGFLDRFSMEARAIAQLDHPNIVPVYDFDQIGELVYIVMKYVEGGTVKETMQSGRPLELGLVVDLVVQIGRALSYAHKRGVIHRDVKPSNILVAEENWALLTDFGLVKMLASDKKLTRSGIGMGTPDYMSPEQAQGFDIDARTDIYSLGATVYEMLAGRVPFEAESSMAVVVKHMTEPPPPLREYNPRVPPAVEQVIMTSMEKDPDKRFQTMDEFVAALVKTARPHMKRPPAFTLDTTEEQDPATPRSPASDAIPTDRWAAVAQERALVAAAERPAAPRPGQLASDLANEPMSWLDEQVGAAPAAALQRSPARHPASRGLVHTKGLRIAFAAAAVVSLVFLCTVGIIAAQILQGWLTLPAIVPTLTIQLPTHTPSATPTWTLTPGPSATPTATPTPTDTPTPDISPTPTPELIYLSPNDRIRAGIYVKVVKEKFVMRGAAGFDADFVMDVPQGFILYVLRTSQAENLDWVQVRDMKSGRVGWGRQDEVAAYALPAPSTATPTP